MKKSVITIFLSLLFIFLGCSNINQNEQVIRTRTMIESSKSSFAYLKVYLENSGGNAISGALVTVRNNQNGVAVIPFDTEKSCYSIETPIPVDEIFHIRIDSLASTKIIEYSIPHRQLITGAFVTTFRDSAGNSVLSGQSIQKDLDIQLTWNSVLENAVYTVAVKTPFETVYQISTKQTSVVISAHTLKPRDDYYIQICTQIIFGDPTFQKYNYYSASCFASNNIGFSIE